MKIRRLKPNQRQNGRDDSGSGSSAEREKGISLSWSVLSFGLFTWTRRRQERTGEKLASFLL